MPFAGIDRKFDRLVKEYGNKLNSDEYIKNIVEWREILQPYPENGARVLSLLLYKLFQLYFLSLLGDEPNYHNAACVHYFIFAEYPVVRKMFPFPKIGERDEDTLNIGLPIGITDINKYRCCIDELIVEKRHKVINVENLDMNLSYKELVLNDRQEAVLNQEEVAKFCANRLKDHSFFKDGKITKIRIAVSPKLANIQSNANCKTLLKILDLFVLYGIYPSTLLDNHEINQKLKLLQQLGLANHGEDIRNIDKLLALYF